MFLKSVQKVVKQAVQVPFNYLPRTNYTTAQNLLETFVKKLESQKVSEPRTSVEIILAHVLQKKSLREVRENADSINVTKEQEEKIGELVEARLERVPVQYIIKEWDFREINLKMVPPVFIPRPETEELINLILQQSDLTKKSRFLEVGKF